MKNSNWILSLLIFGFLLMSFTNTYKSSKYKNEMTVVNCDSNTVYFKQQILPILETNCVSCHNPNNAKHQVILNSYEGIMATVEIESEDEDDSNKKLEKNKLAKVILRDKMPPGSHKKLNDDEKLLIYKWIDQGMQNNSCENITQNTMLATITYESQIKSILNINCNECHSGNEPAKGYDLTDINTLKLIIENGELMGTIQHEPGFKPMPYKSDKMSESDIETIRIWIQNGMP
jgi:mono/diheme cytochrome c family protein